MARSIQFLFVLGFLDDFDRISPFGSEPLLLPSFPPLPVVPSSAFPVVPVCVSVLDPGDVSVCAFSVVVGVVDIVFPLSSTVSFV